MSPSSNQKPLTYHTYVLNVINSRFNFIELGTWGGERLCTVMFLNSCMTIPITSVPSNFVNYLKVYSSTSTFYFHRITQMYRMITTFVTTTTKIHHDSHSVCSIISDSKFKQYFSPTRGEKVVIRSHKQQLKENILVSPIIFQLFF